LAHGRPFLRHDRRHRTALAERTYLVVPSPEKARCLQFPAGVTGINFRPYAVAILLGSALGCVYTLAASQRDNDPIAAPTISPTTSARWIAPLAIPPRENYGAPYVKSRVHPLAVAAGIIAASVFGLAAFSVSPPKTPNRTLGRSARSRSA
jgi:hypothetical protein